MIRPLVAALSLGFIVIAFRPAAAQSDSVPLISREAAQQIGLQRAWVTQIPLDRARSKITHIKLQSGLLLVVTNENTLYVVDPESGQIQWSFQIGDRKLEALSPSANATHVAVASTARLYLLNRATGDVVMDRAVTGTPERGPVLLAQKIFLPLVKGPLETYPRDDYVVLDQLNLEKNVLTPAFFPSAGRMFGPPATSDDLLVWSGDLNQLNAHLFAEHPVDFSKIIPESISTAPTLFGSTVYIGTERGYALAFETLHFNEIWRFATGSPIHRRPIVTNSAVFVLPEDGGMYALDPMSGEMLWFAPDPVQFVSASPQRLYAIDNFHRLIMLNPKTGARTGTVTLPPTIKLLTNDYDDRLVMYTDQGFVQTLHEPALAQPAINAPPKPEPVKKGVKPGAADAKSDKPAAAEAKPDNAAPAAAK